jgi:hypothetical protein
VATFQSQDDDSDEIRELFHQYIQALREYITVNERCQLKGWPDRKVAIMNATKVKSLYCDSAVMRLAYLLRYGVSTDTWLSIGDILNRISGGWKDAEEIALKGESPQYLDLSREAESAQAAMDEVALEGPIQGARRDPEWQEAALAFGARQLALDADLTKLNLP